MERYKPALQGAQPSWPQPQIRAPGVAPGWAPRFIWKTENFFSTFREPHFTQTIFWRGERTSASKRCSHFPQAYSNVGMA